MNSVTSERPVTAATDAESELAEVLAGVLSVNAVPADSHFFDELGADSLVMAQFCARVRKRGDLPPISMKDIYAHPTIRKLAASIPFAQPATAPTVRELPTPTNNREYLVCGALQALCYIAYSYLGVAAAIEGYQWIVADAQGVAGYLRFVLFSSVAFLAVCAVPIAAKWLIVGRWKPGQIRIWSLAYLRFWIVKTLIRSNPGVYLFVGSPLYGFYLRALGAKVGPGVVVLSRDIPVCTDLLTIGAGTVIRRESTFLGYRALAGRIEMGPVTLGHDVFVGEASVLDINTSMGDGAQLGHSSSLHSGQSVPTGERWHGSPARRTDVNYLRVPPARCGTLRRATAAALTLIGILFVWAPLLEGGVSLLFVEVSSLVKSGLVIEALACSAALFFGTVFLGLLAVGILPRALRGFIKPDTVYPLYGFHYSVHRVIVGLNRMKFLGLLFGDSSYMVHFLKWAGFRLNPVVQTGSNFGCEVATSNPFLTRVGTGTMVADGLNMFNDEISSTSFRVSQATIGPNNFLGNYISYPAGGRTGNNCLLAIKVLVPLDGPVREGVGLLGSPPFEIPRSVERDSQFDHLRTGEALRRGLTAKNWFNLRTIGIFLLTRWVGIFLITVIDVAAFTFFFDVWAHAIMAALFALSVVVAAVYYAAVEGFLEAISPPPPAICSIYDRRFWWIERIWKLHPIHFLHLFDGTPFKNVLWQLIGVRIGKRMFDDGVYISEPTLTTIGDECVFNALSIIQCDSQEDGTYKSGRTTLGSGCTLGVSAFVHYGVTMGDGAVLATDSFLMKGEEVPAGARWGGNPAREKYESSEMNLPDPVNTAERARAFWRGVLLNGSFTTLPRWTREPVACVREYDAKIPETLVAALRRRADELRVPLGAVLLTAHAKVLGALSGEREVTTGYGVGNGSPLPCQMTIALRSWREVLREIAQTESALRQHKNFPVDALRQELGLTQPLFETMFELGAGDGELPDGTVLRVRFLERDEEGLMLKLKFRTEALDVDCAARIAGCHLNALRLIADDPDAEHARQSLLSEAELRLQLESLSGPSRKLPDRRVHELFEERARAHPDAIAVMHGHTQRTYGDLNARANRLARALLARGLSREGVVGVVTERNLDWLTAVLAIFKAGGAYLPIEPHFPADRIARTLTRAGCYLVLTEHGSTATLDSSLDSLPGIQKIFINAACEEGHADGELGIDVAPDQLAYIYFTSGSTGEPKGAMCEQAGMLNHLFAKIDDLGIGAADVVAQTAPQCFDISLWQLLSALLVGGRTLLIEQEVILDAKRFVDKLVEGRVTVVQVVPSYLEVVLTYLEQHPRELRDLRFVSATGEALKKELTQRWFAIQPGIKVLNAYGLTETSDDTNHEILHSVPRRERVPLGRPINNVRVYVVDEHLSLVPLGAPGEIVFSGVCVGRGYINDPERTGRAFLTDPYRAGQRLYRSGDFGRWLPEGKLEFLGRRDSQVKINGFRIEIGEIENRLLQLPGVREGAVVVTERADRSKQLVAFYSAERPLDAEMLREELAASLPQYMLPSAFHWRDTLPLTANGKTDRKTLTALAGEIEVAGQSHEKPDTAAEQRLAAAWAAVLGIPQDQIGRQDNFFELGGTSLSAVRLAIALERELSFKDLAAHPVLADQATLVSNRKAVLR
jgi:non-ribosomal peptide synthetase-like protein